MSTIQKFKDTIRDIPDFPSKGILFKDITPVLANPKLCSDLIELLAAPWRMQEIGAVAGVESRGFLFGMSLAGMLGIPFIPLRKKGKLPGNTFKTEYQLEYGSATLEMHKDAIFAKGNILIHDDLLATGGSAKAAADLIDQSGSRVAGFSFLIELAFFKARVDLEKTARTEFILSY